MRLENGSLYLDCNATLPTKKEVLSAFLRAEKEGFANPSSSYLLGKRARKMVEHSRENILSKLNFNGNLVFTSSATEANNLLLLSASFNERIKKIIVSRIEHPSISEVIPVLKKQGSKVEEIRVGRDGVIDLERLDKSVSFGCFVSVIAAHNETGVIQPIREIAEICTRKNALFHTDLVQAFGKIKLPFESVKPNALTIASHKIGGPKGIGALIFDDKIKIVPMIRGGGQEKGYRSSTESVPLIFAFSKAVELTDTEKFFKLKTIRDEMEKLLSEKFSLTIYGKNSPRLPNTSFFSIEGFDGREIQNKLNKEKIYIGTGSACHGAGLQIPRVVLEMGYTNVDYPLRISFSSMTKERDIRKFVSVLCEILRV